MAARKKTEAELTQAAVITNGDVSRAKQAWRDGAPSALRALLDAEAIPARTKPAAPKPVSE